MKVEKSYPWSSSEHRYGIVSETKEEAEILWAMAKLVSQQSKESSISGSGANFTHLKPGFVSVNLLIRPEA